MHIFNVWIIIMQSLNGGVTDYTNQTPLTDTPYAFRMEKCLTPVKMKKYLSNVHKMGGALFNLWTIIMQSLN